MTLFFIKIALHLFMLKKDFSYSQCISWEDFCPCGRFIQFFLSQSFCNLVYSLIFCYIVEQNMAWLEACTVVVSASCRTVNLNLCYSRVLAVLLSSALTLVCPKEMASVAILHMSCRNISGKCDVSDGFRKSRAKSNRKP